MMTDTATLFSNGAKLMALFASCFALAACGTADLAPYRDHFTAAPVPVGSENNAGDIVTIRFLGNTNFLISDGDTSILIDGYFSYPIRTSLGGVFRRIAPDPAAVAAAMADLDVDKIAAIIPIHSHYDHAMDVGEVGSIAKNAEIFGSSSTENILHGWRIWKDKKTGNQSTSAVIDRFNRHTSSDSVNWLNCRRCGRFEIARIPATHNQSCLNDRFGSGPIREKLVPPKTIFSYKEGEAYSVLIKHRGADGEEKTVLIVGSAAAPPDIGDSHALDGVAADVLLLGAAGMVHRDERHVEYLEKTVDAVNPRVIAPVHWDSIFSPPAHGEVAAPSGFYAMGAKVDVGLSVLCNDVRVHNKENADALRRFVMLPYNQPAPLFSLKVQGGGLDNCPAVPDRWNRGALRDRWE